VIEYKAIAENIRATYESARSEWIEFYKMYLTARIPAHLMEDDEYQAAKMADRALVIMYHHFGYTWPGYGL